MIQVRSLTKLLLAPFLFGTGALIGATGLTSGQQKALDYLTASWGVNMRVSGIDIALAAVGGEYTYEDRFALGAYIRDHPEVHEVRRRFGWETIALTPATVPAS